MQGDFIIYNTFKLKTCTEYLLCVEHTLGTKLGYLYTIKEIMNAQTRALKIGLALISVTNDIMEIEFSDFLDYIWLRTCLESD